MTTEIQRGADSVWRVMSVIAAVVESRGAPLGVRAIARLSGVPSSSVHRYLKSMEDMRLVVPVVDRYAVGPEMERLAQLIVAASPFPRVAQPELDRLAESTGETAVLAVYDYELEQLMFVAQSEGRHPLRYHLPLHQWISPLQGASGLAIVAFLSESASTALLNKEPSRDAIRVEIEKIRQNGVAISHGQRIHGAVGIASPVFDTSGSVIGDVSLTVPETRFDAREQDQLADAVRETARRISRTLGAPLVLLEVLERV